MIAIQTDIAVKFCHIMLMIFTHFSMSNFLNIINAVKTDWWAMKIKVTAEWSQDHKSQKKKWI